MHSVRYDAINRILSRPAQRNWQQPGASRLYFAPFRTPSTTYYIYPDIQTSETVSPASLLNMAAWQTTKGKNHDFNTKLLFWPAQRA